MPGVFARTARPAILAAAKSQGLRRAAERLPLTRDVVRRFVPGETIDDVMTAVAVLRDSGRMVSIDFLGEDVTDAQAATATVESYVKLLDALGRRGDAVDEGVRPLEVSVKLTALGASLAHDGRKVALDNARTVCAAAQRAGVWVTFDAEDHTTTDTTLVIVTELRADFGWVGTVLQAYLRRTYGDCEQFADMRIRLCKGAYDEPVSVAYRAADEVTAEYLRCLALLMSGAGYPMVASHDPAIISAAAAMVRENGRQEDTFEYQMLYGIREPEQLRLARAGDPMRVYVPFGTQWYGYFVRRLAERPANVMFFLRALTERGR